MDEKYTLSSNSIAKKRGPVPGTPKPKQHRAKLLDPRNKGTFFIALAIAFLVLATSGLISYSTVASAAIWMRLDWPWLVWVVPGFIEILIIFSGLDYLITRANGGTGNAPLVWMLLFSAIAIITNAAHTIAQWGLGAFNTFQPWVGVLLSAAAPLVVVLITKRVSSIAFINTKGN